MLRPWKENRVTEKKKTKLRVNSYNMVQDR